MRFDPPLLDMGPVLPRAPEGDIREVTVMNEGTWDVEIFSLDFDKVRGTRNLSGGAALGHVVVCLSC